MEGLMLKTSVQSLIHHPQAGTQRSQTPAAQCQLALCSPFSSRSVSHSLESRHLSSSAKVKNNRVAGAGVVVRAAAQTGEVVDMSALDGISIYTTFGKEVKFTDLWDQTNVSYRIPPPSFVGSLILSNLLCLERKKDDADAAACVNYVVTSSSSWSKYEF